MTDTVDNFASLNLSAPLLTALADVGYETPSPIQAACIPLLLAGHDLLGEAQTGTGKTAAFALPLLERLNPNLRKPQVLVLTPTRELAIQVAEAFQRYAKYLRDFHVLPLYGGQSMVVQLRQLNRGAQVIVGTPGRVMDHIERESLQLDGLQALVLDEADEMLRMGFIDDVDWILEHIPAERQTALFSATMPEPIRRVARQHMREPQEIKIKAATTTVATIRQRYWAVRGVHKLDALTRILEVEEDFDAALIFVRTKTATTELADKLEARGYAVAALNGDMNQALRERVIEQLKTGSLDIVVATDVAARGIDVARVSHVINYDIPYDTEAYVHRIGRTGRAGRQGTAILFVAPRETGMLRAIERATRQPIEQISLPSKEAVADRRITQFKQQVAEAIEALEDNQLDFFAEVVDQLATEKSLDTAEIAAALAYLLQRERPLQLEEGGKGWDLATAPVSPPAHERPRRENRDEILTKRRDFVNSGMQRYRIEVGREHGATPKEIVGAIANEGGIEGRNIGQINLFDTYSTVELPELPAELLNFLKSTRVRQIPINIRLALTGEGDEARGRGGDRDGRFAKPAHADRNDRHERERSTGNGFSDRPYKKPYESRNRREDAPTPPRASTKPPYSSERERSTQDRPSWHKDETRTERDTPRHGDAPLKRGFADRKAPPRPASTGPSRFAGSKPAKTGKRGH
ncbi:DEAD/DEAH box helicase [Uliginosibacterium gangwonense]|uniref:DEAD/DEAH box helicase n=1 Tax=Uliginosibacterium gangwonense TaxID=392736 RepID=UPI000362A422|nr:DEAD/DEAH box helicase [Uliginosibacterium gangwonense]